MIFRRLASFLGLSSVVAVAISSRSSSLILCRSSAVSSSRMASAPMPAVKLSSPNFSCASRYCSSDEQLALLELGDARLDDDVVLEIEHALEILERHVHQQADARGQRLQEPDVRDRGRQLDMAHALAAHLGQRHLDAALLADQALVLHALVLAAQALVVLDRSKDARAEQPVPLGLEGPVVDRLGLADFAERPRHDVVRAGDRDADLIEALNLGLRVEKVDDLLVHVGSPLGRPAVRPACGEKLQRRRSGEWPGRAVVDSAKQHARRTVDPRRLTNSTSLTISPIHSAAGGSCCCFSSSWTSPSTAALASAKDSSWTLRLSARISLTSTLKLSGMPASKLSSPRTIAS